MKEKYGIEEIIGELDPTQQKCGQCKTFKSKDVFIGGGFLENCCPICITDTANRIRNSIKTTGK